MERGERIPPIAQDQDIDKIAFLLRTWAASEKSDSVRRQEQRGLEYSQACDLLDRIVTDIARRNQELLVTLSSESQPVRLKSLNKGAYDFISVDDHNRSLQPSESFALKIRSTLRDVSNGPTGVYFGDYRGELEVADIARILTQGGSLEVVDAPTDS